MANMTEECTLVIRFRSAGFFSNFNGVIDNLRFRLGRKGASAARVEWQGGGKRLPASYGRSVDDNLWLHFFEPLPFDAFPGRVTEITEFTSHKMSSRFAYAMYKLDRNWRAEYHAVYQRYIRVQQPFLDKVEAIYRTRMKGAYCAGVHYRHPEHDKECLHPIAAPEIFISRLRKFLPQDRPWVVFLATDVESVVEIFRNAFGSRLVLQPDVRRAASAQEKTLHNQDGTSDLALAEEVLIDTLLLARCDLLLHVTSNIATAAGYINPSLRMVYCESMMQAAWGYIWSVLFNSPKRDRLIYRPGSALTSAVRHGHGLVRFAVRRAARIGGHAQNVTRIVFPLKKKKP